MYRLLLIFLVVCNGCFAEDWTATPITENLAEDLKDPIIFSQNGEKKLQLLPENERQGNNYYELVISTTDVGEKDKYGFRKAYSPYDFTDAWRELDHMLPGNYIALAVNNINLSTCGMNEPRVAKITGKLNNNLIAAWMDDIRKREFDDFVENFIKASGVAVDGRNATDWPADKSGAVVDLTLCSYFFYKKTGKYMPLDEIYDRYRKFIKQLNKERTQKKK